MTIIRTVVAAILTILFLNTTALRADPPPIPPAPTEVGFQHSGDGDGTKESPFLYTIGSKGKLTLINIPEGTRVKWNLKESPADTEILPDKVTLWFPTDAPNLYPISVATATADALDSLSCWIEIKGPNGPPNPISLTQRIIRGFTGQPIATLQADAKTFKAAMLALSPQVEQGKITTLLQLQDALEATLKGTGWTAARYPELSQIAGELSGVNVPERPINVPLALEHMATVIKACDQVIAKAVPPPPTAPK